MAEIFENANDAIVYGDLTGKILDLNKKAEELAEIKKEEILGKPFWKLGIIDPKNMPMIFDRLRRKFEGKQSATMEIVVTKRSGEKRFVEVSSTILRKDQAPAGFMAIVRDVTEKKQAEEALRESEERFRTIATSANDGIILTDADGRILYWNRAAEEIFSYKEEDVIGREFAKFLIPKRLYNIMTKELAEFKKTGASPLIGGTHDFIGVKRDGTEFPIEFSVSALQMKGKWHAVAIIRDVTERKRFEKRLSALHVYSRDLNMAKSMKEIYRLTLDAMEKTLGFEIAFFMVVDKDMLCFVDHRGYPESFSIKLPLDGTKKGVSVKVAKTGRPIYVPDVTKDDDWVQFMPGIRSGLDVPVKIGDEVLGVIGVDSKRLNAFNKKDQELLEILASHAATAISNLDRAKNLETYTREIRESQQKFERLFVDNPEAAVYMNPGFHIVDINPRFTELFDYSLDEVKGKHIDDIVVPNGKMKEGKMLNKKALKGYVYYDTVRKRKDGSLVSVSVAAAPIIVEGQLLGYIGIYKDITERKQMEKKLEEYSQHLEELVEQRTMQLKEAHEQLIKSERLAAVGELAAMVGHDLRNPLTGISGAAYYLKIKLGSQMDEKLQRMLTLIERNIEYSNKIIADLLDYSREIRLEFSRFSLKSIIKEALSMVKILGNIKVSNLISDETFLEADAGKLKRAFVNIIKNAVEAMPRSGQLVIKSKQANGFLEITFADTGVGMPKELLEQIWTPFRTTKAKGMGLGLPICKRIVEAHGGSVSAESTVGRGTTFRFTIPVSQKGNGGEKTWVKEPEYSLSRMTRA